MDKPQHDPVFSPLKPFSNNKLNLIAFDTEDNGRGAPDNLLCACFYSESEGKRHFITRQAAREYMFKSRNARTVFVAHNLYYDITNLDYPENTVHLIPKAFGGIIGGTYNPNKNIEYKFIDTSNFFVGAPLKKLGESLGMKDTEKLEYDVLKLRGKKFDDFTFDEQNELLDYCMQDAKICYSVMKKIIDMTDMNTTRFKSYTAASLALAIFRTNFLAQKIRCRPMRINDIERMAYYGGRTEVFDFNRHENVVYEDIKSSYPTAMFFKDYPDPQTYTILSNPYPEIVEETEGISLVTVEVPDMHIPPLPYRQLHQGGVRLIFPTGIWSAAYTHPELRMAIKYGVKIKAVHATIMYPQMIRPFKSYVEKFYRLKETTKGIDREFYKLLLNGLSGKFGEKRTFLYRGKLQHIPLHELQAMMGEDGSHTSPDANGWINITGRRLDDPKHTFPVWIAYITAYGRIKLYEERLSRCKTLYCDTDSCISTDAPDDNNGNELGQWERKIYPTFMANAPKDYDLAGKAKRKGIPSRATWNEEHAAWRYERPLKQSEAMRRHMMPNTWVEVFKQNKYKVFKRNRLKDGTTTPYRVADLRITSWDELLKKYQGVLD